MWERAVDEYIKEAFQQQHEFDTSTTQFIISYKEC